MLPSRLRPLSPKVVQPATSKARDNGRQRRCSKCHQHLPLAAFNRAGDDHQWWCRECFKAYFRERGQAHRDHVRRNKGARVGKARHLVFGLLHASACTDCGESHPAVLEFDHVDRKCFGISAAVAGGVDIDRLEQELARCEIVCANCHRRRTIDRGDHWRSRPASEEQRGPRTRQRAAVRAWLADNSCLDCAENDLRVLEFDHVRGDKLASVAQLVVREASLERLADEIAKCDVVCANCHRRRTAQRAGWKRLTWQESSYLE